MNSKNKSYLNKAEHPLVTVDVVVFTIGEDELKTLLIKRKFSPFEGDWALPGGFIQKSEEPETAARRELREETGVDNIFLEQLYTFGNPKRDPRGRVLTVSYFALAPRHKLKISESSSESKATNLFSINKLPKLAFDHKEIISTALIRLQNKIQYTNAAWSLLPENFAVSQLQKVYEIILDKKLDKRNFRKKIISLGLLKSSPKKLKGLRQRPAKLFTFKTKKYTELKRFF